ncbi:unnamed protein product [Arctia plantaginis]|uniref:Uncharacterized protein n=1 Tax=Arctia plantaginis TaxID=874455 RepID=A0A8S1A5W5_ARCPL|nr:unnamed protein product [Arctia plantaginis]CAB3240566.1 unnamed protein product [Arctia plantaginis]
MGTITSKDTRRISFANTCALTTPIVIQNSIEVENAIAFNELPAEPSNELLFKEKYSNLTEEGDGDYWSHRMDYLKKEHQEINKIIESEYDKKIEAANVTSESPKILHDKLQKVKPCFDWRAKILKCYEDNPHQTLVCSSVVQAFTNCVTNCRLED